ncbi:PH domain-containing protein [Pseudonocardia bannensis]|uniref:PH domain-containing protein n=1 Tax=Pseudonocardia bannensis TaxID=630973 RepID=A0A848DBL3_9PSEU|nr:PH domain-containing protein [Pseudonocardia bannensis]NMH90167.1 PH domain-containing protein [Pseudonocardia bannensis]
MQTAPPPPPTALPLRPPAHQVHPRAVRWWQLRDVLGTVLLTAPQLAVLLVLGADAPGWLPVTAGVTAVLGLAYALVVPRILYRIHRWEVTGEAVYTLSGWLVREWRIAPISRVQTVDTEHGPLQQLLKLASVTVTTASARGPVTIRGLDADDAAELARVLTETTQAVPGDAT